MKNNKKPLVAERMIKISKADKKWDIDFWQKAGAQSRFSATWQMISEFYKIRGKNGIKQRLRRTIQNIEQI